MVYDIPVSYRSVAKAPFTALFNIKYSAASDLSHPELSQKRLKLILVWKFFLNKCLPFFGSFIFNKNFNLIRLNITTPALKHIYSLFPRNCRVESFKGPFECMHILLNNVTTYFRKLFKSYYDQKIFNNPFLGLEQRTGQVRVRFRANLRLRVTSGDRGMCLAWGLG